ncbi:MAG: hypothetical protein A3H27_09105 [Acidobacteria bacterium RIFCSPLOWO2_02_FULL_59_13]|nr:MAG: hypothetical protein A3H27_09105 [Acidobacteria bacterium RIFCSPLOWO2_02_FULL_59_13]
MPLMSISLSSAPPAESDRSGLAGKAGGGIGTAITRRFLKKGTNVFALDRDEEALGRLIEAMNESPALSIRTMDVSSEQACEEFARAVGAKWDGVDILINNAGYFPIRNFEEMTYAEWRHVCAINLDGVFLMLVPSHLNKIFDSTGLQGLGTPLRQVTVEGESSGGNHYAAF